MDVRAFILAFLFGLCFTNVPTQAQCFPDIFAIHYQGNAACNVFKTITTPSGDMIAVGNVLQINGGLGYDGWMIRMSSRGKIHWARRYMPPAYNTGQFYSLVLASDSTFFATGRFGFIRRRASDNQIEELYSVNLLVHFDKFGVPLSMRAMNKYVTYFTALDKAIKTNDGDYIIGGTISGMNYYRNLLFRMNNAGNIVWSKQFHTDEVYAGTTHLKMLNDGNIIAGGVAFKNAPDWSEFLKQGWHLLKFDAANGNLIWSKGIYFKNSAEPRLYSSETFRNIEETPNGDLRLFSSYSNDVLLAPPQVENACVLTLDRNASLKEAIAYRIPGSGTQLLDAQMDATGNMMLLLDDGTRSVLASINSTGDPVWQKAYGGMNYNLKGRVILNINSRNTILYTGRTNIAMLGLLKTEANGDMSCTETVMQPLEKEVVTSQMTIEPLSFFTAAGEMDLFEPFGGGINRVNYNFQTNIDCEITCCNFTRSDTSDVTLCNASSFLLPDNSVVRETGLYYTTHKTPANCDSVAYYNVTFANTPKPDLGPDDCFNGRTTIELRVDSGYQEYNWMGNTTAEHRFQVSTQGTYWVSISNICGTGKDTIKIYDECNFEIYVPTGFTPNNDGLNDEFGVPYMNRNRFISLKIFNRWGQLVFQTRDQNVRWDGTIRKVPQPVGTYVFVVEMESLNGKRLNKTGTFTLIR